MIKKFTAIIATYNSEKTISKCINSILDQDYKLLEIIIIDNNSSDGTISKIKSINDDRLKFISEYDEGIYDAWNKGLNISTGDIIHFIGSDDYMNSSTVYSEISNKIDDSYIPDAIATSIYISNRNSQIIDIVEASTSRSANHLMNPFMGIFFNKNVFELLGGFDKHYKICGDYELKLRFDQLFTEEVEKNIVSIKMVIGGVSSNFNTSNKLSMEILRASLENKKYEYVFKIILICIKSHIYKIIYEIFGFKITAYIIDYIRLLFGRDKYWTR